LLTESGAAIDKAAASGLEGFGIKSKTYKFLSLIVTDAINLA